MKYYQPTGADKIIFWIIGGFVVLILILIGFVARGESQGTKGGETIQKYETSDTDKPVVQVHENSKDIGRMNVKDERKTDFTIKNTGRRPLQLFNITSSCDCTAGQVTINSVKSPEFSMHDKREWSGTVNPGETATVSVVYRPQIMPVKGDISRSVYVQTNDPKNDRLTFTIQTFVE